MLCPYLLNGTSSIISPTTLKLQLLNTDIELHSPIITKYKKQFFPLRDILKVIKAELNYSKKNDIYKLNFNDIQCIIVPYSKDFWINNEHQFLSEKPILYQNRLYVPLEEFFTITGHKISKKKGKIAVSKKKLSTSTNYYSNLPKKTEKKEVLDKTNVFENKTELTQLSLPNKREYDAIILRLSKDNTLTTSSYFEKNDILYAPLTPLLEKEGIKISKKRNHVILVHQDKELKISTQTNKVTIKSKKQTINKFIQSPLIIKDKTIFYPITSIASLFNLKL